MLSLRTKYLFVVQWIGHLFPKQVCRSSNLLRETPNSRNNNKKLQTNSKDDTDIVPWKPVFIHITKGVTSREYIKALTENNYQGFFCDT